MGETPSGPPESFDWQEFEHDRLDKQGQFTDRQIRDHVGETHHPGDVERREVDEIRRGVKPASRPTRRGFTPKHEITDEMVDEEHQRNQGLPTEQERLIGLEQSRPIIEKLEESERQKLQRKAEASTEGVLQDE